MNLKHSELEALDLSNRLIKLDYPYNPKRRPFDPKNSKVFTMIEKQRSNYAALLTAFSKYDTHFQKIPTRHLAQEQNSLAPQWNNGWFPCLDAITLYGLIATTNPKRYVEVGSGNSTMFARQAIKDHRLQTSITSVDPFPRAHIDSICDLVIRTPCEDVATDVFSSLTAGDILFIDNSHRSFPNSDVTVFFTEILPTLPKGVIYGLHDIFIPWDYPDEWKERYYNEQYLLASYLIGGAGGDEIILPNTYLSYYDPELLAPLAQVFKDARFNGAEKTGTAFWMKKG